MVKRQAVMPEPPSGAVFPPRKPAGLPKPAGGRDWLRLGGLVLALAAGGAAAVGAEIPSLGQARQLLAQDQPAQAENVISQLRQQNPGDPWLAYDTGVAAYAARDFTRADRIWQELAGRELPKSLRDKVWMQIGNSSFRLGEQVAGTAPEKALPPWEQSREAYRVALVSPAKDPLALHNLKVVETRLAHLHSLLAQRLVQEAQKQALRPAISKLQAALDHQRTARDLDPQNSEYARETRATETQLAGKFTEKARQEEQKTDKTVNSPSTSEWEREQAIENLGVALADFREARQLDAHNDEARQGEPRVEKKLARLLAQAGREHQQEAQYQASFEPEKAVENYEKALDKFGEALQHDRANREARTGEREVKEALEKLHLKEGDFLADAGKKDAPRQPARAAEEMMNALDHFQEARRLNPENPETPPKIEDLEKRLPPLLNQLGKQEQAKAEKAEGKSEEEAVAHLEKASSSFDKSQQLKPGDQESKQGQEQVQKDLARLRERLAKPKDSPPAKPSRQPSKEDSLRNFQSLLAVVKDPERQREYEQDRRGQTRKYTPDQDRIHKNW